MTRQKPSLLLFILRLFFYLSVAFLPFLHPGIVISYDRIGIIKWFVIIPFEALVAFLPPLKGKMLHNLILALLPLLIFSLWAGALSITTWQLFFTGFAVFILTLTLFRYPRWAKLSIMEPFFLAWVCIRLLQFSRSGEDISGESLGLTQFILVWTALVFLLHSAVVYFCLYPPSRGGAKREGFIFGFAAAAALVLAILVLPADFIRNTVVANLLNDRLERRTKPQDNDWGIPDSGGRSRENRRTLPGDRSGQDPSLRGLSEHDWPSEGSRRRGGSGEGGEERQQYTVMVTASKNDPVYMGDSIRARLDPVEGFLLSQDEALNRLPSQRFFVTWFDSEADFDLGRKKNEVYSLSTLARKFLPYRPFAIEPTIRSENTGPFRYIHRVVSNIHPDDPMKLLGVSIRELSPLEKENLAASLELPLEEKDLALFRAHLDRVIDSWQKEREEIMGEKRNDYMEKVIAILRGFSDYQYDVNDDDGSSIQDLIDFLYNTKEGDCVEFSNTAALLGRLAGIPSRVVTGFLASKGLQTVAHLRGLAALRSKIPALQDFPFEDLYLVTDAHGHSWPQFYIPGYGWLDFEATYFAIPPVGMGDGNMRDVVIPLIDDDQVFAPVRAFPWRAVLRVLAFLAVLALALAYVMLYGREALLWAGTRQGGRQGARSLYLLLLSRLAADGKPIKPVSKTAPEYARLFQGIDPPSEGAGESQEGPFEAFAALYTELRWKDFGDKAEEDRRFRALKGEYRKILTMTRRKGLRAFIIRIFSLRGLKYL